MGSICMVVFFNKGVGVQTHTSVIEAIIGVVVTFKCSIDLQKKKSADCLHHCGKEGAGKDSGKDCSHCIFLV